MRKTHTLIQVAVTLAANPDGTHWGYVAAQQAGIRPGALYPILTRLVAAGWLADGWEDPASISGRPPRRYYQLTKLGKAEIAALLDEARQDPRFAAILTNQQEGKTS